MASRIYRIDSKAQPNAPLFVRAHTPAGAFQCIAARNHDIRIAKPDDMIGTVAADIIDGTKDVNQILLPRAAADGSD